MDSFEQLREAGDGVLSVTLERESGMAFSPAYTVTLRRDGSIGWRGKVGALGADGAGGARGVREVERRGEFNPDDFDRLAALVVRSGFISWDERYEGYITCQPAYRLSVTTLDGGRTVQQAGGSEDPPDFWVIAELVDHIAEQAEWESESE